MALEQTGLSSVLTFNERSAVRAMGRASRAFTGLQASAARSGDTVIVSAAKLRRASQASRLLAGNLGRATRAFKFLGSAATKAGSIVSRAGVATTNFGRSIGFAALALLPFTLALKKGGEQAADFEQAMADAAAVNPRQTEGMGKVTKEVRKLGRNTKFTAVEVARSFEQMRRAGLATVRSTSLLGPATKLAAAGGLGLADATKVMTKTAIVFKKQGISDADVVDKLALASTKSTANLAEMGVALGFTSGAAAQLNIPLEATLAGLAQVQTRTKEGSRAGTAFNAMITRLAEKTKKGRIQIEGMTVKFRKNEKGQLDLMNTLNDVNRALAKKFPDATDRAGAASRFFGKRAGRAFNAIAGDINEFKKTLNALEDPTQFRNIAAEMEKMRLNTFTGQLTILKSAITDLNIEFFGQLLKTLTPVLKRVRVFVSDVTTAMEFFREAMNGTVDQAIVAIDEYEKIETTARLVGAGLVLAVEDIKDAFKGAVSTVKDFVKNVMEKLGVEGRVDIIMFTKFAAKLAVVLGLIAPLLAFGSLLVIMFGTMVSSVGSIISALAALKGVALFLLGGALIPFIKVILIIGAVIAVAVLLFKAFQREGESISDTFIRLWNDSIKPFIDGFVKGFAPAIEVGRRIFLLLKDTVMTVLGELVDAFRPVIEMITGTSSESRSMGEIFGAVLGVIAVAIQLVVGALIWFQLNVLRVAIAVGAFIIKHAVRKFQLLRFNIMEVIGAIKDIFSGNIANGFVRLGKVIVSNLLGPFSTFLSLLFDAAEAVLGIKIPDSVRRFIEAPVPKKEPPAAPVTAVQKAAEAAAKPKLEANVIVKDDSETTLKTELNIDGSEIANATAKHQKELRDRQGVRSTRFQRRMVAEQGAVSV